MIIVINNGCGRETKTTNVNSISTLFMIYYFRFSRLFAKEYVPCSGNLRLYAKLANSNRWQHCQDKNKGARLFENL